MARAVYCRRLTSSLPSPVAASTDVARAMFAFIPAILAAPLSNSLLFNASISDLLNGQFSTEKQ